MNIKKLEYIQYNKKHWDSNAEIYDENHLREFSACYYVEMQRIFHILPLIEVHLNSKHNDNGAIRILDVACGTGYYLEIYSQNNCIGMDISRNMIQCCKEKKLKNIFIANYENLPFTDNVFDIVLCINAFHYSKNPNKLLKEIRRVLKSDGKIILTYFNLYNFRALVHKIRDLFGIKTNIETRYSYRKIKMLFDNNRLLPIYLVGCNFLPYKINGKPRTKHILKWLEYFEKKNAHGFLKHFCNEVIVKLEKKD